MKKCSAIQCEKDAKFGVKIGIIDELTNTLSGGYINLPVCEDHRSDDNLRMLVDRNWEMFKMGIQRITGIDPTSLAEVAWKWVPLEEVEDFFRENAPKARKEPIN